MLTNLSFCTSSLQYHLNFYMDVNDLYCEIYTLFLELNEHCKHLCLCRYVATSVTSVHEMENGFHIWSFNGKLLYNIPKDHFYQVHDFIFNVTDFMFNVRLVLLKCITFESWSSLDLLFYFLR